MRSPTEAAGLKVAGTSQNYLSKGQGAEHPHQLSADPR